MISKTLVIGWVLLTHNQPFKCFRLWNSSTEFLNATRYEKDHNPTGIVGYLEDLVEFPAARRNETFTLLSSGTSRLNHYELPKQNCPGMVGPIQDGEFYCRGKEFGTCDRRSGICVCEPGYAGIDCAKCAPTHIEIGLLCYPRKRCPNDCSESGTCDYFTGTCTCFAYRKGSDCSHSFCDFGPLCRSCSETACIGCVEGYFLDSVLNTCVSCSIHDPRCLDCNSTACFQCVDLLLNSVQRSGARLIDEPLPLDEMERQFRKPFPFGSQDPHFFDDVESAYRVVATRKHPLNSQSHTCVQGSSWDATWDCTPQTTSHVVCGHEGAFSFSSPAYEVRESASNLTVKVIRNGGGYGDVLISYRLGFITASPSDVTGSAFYTSSNTLLFHDGTIALSFVLTIHDDLCIEKDETFYIELLPPESTDRSQVDASLGPFSQTLVTIIDDDVETIHPKYTHVETNSALRLQTYNHFAGKTSEVIIQAVMGTKSDKVDGGDLILLESGEGASRIHSDGDLFLNERQPGITTDFGNGTYRCTWKRKSASKNITVAVYVLHSGGLRGEYYSDAWLQSSPEAIRSDAVLNFTWDRGMIFPSGTDFVSVQWCGRIKPKTSEYTTFFVECDDHVRLYIDGILLIDHWNPNQRGLVTLQTSMELDASQYYPIMIEYRDLAGNAAFILSWKTPNSPREVIPATNLFRAYHIHQSPFYQVSVKAETITAASTTTIEGDFSTVSGKRTVFTLFARDKYGNLRQYDDIFQVDGVKAYLLITEDQSRGGTSPKVYDAMVEFDSQNQTLRLVFYPLLSGTYDLDVRVNGRSIHASPYKMHVFPDSLHPGTSHVLESSLNSIHVAGVKSTMLLEARDVYYNRIIDGGNASMIEFRAMHTTKLGDHIDDGIIIDNGDGTYEVAYTLRFSGTYKFHILWRSYSEMSDGPFLISVLPNVPDSSKCIAQGEGVHEAIASEQNQFTIMARDTNENDVMRGGSNFTVLLQWEASSPDDDHNITGSCIDLSNGKYTCAYVPQFAGFSRLYVHLNIISNDTIASKPIADSPFEIHVKPGKVYASTSMAFGEGLIAAVAGESASFTVMVRDRNRNVQLSPDTEIPSVVILGPLSPQVVAGKTFLDSCSATFVNRTKDGFFRMEYKLERKGNYKLSVQVEDIDIHGSPFSVRVYPNKAYHASSSLELCASTISSFYAGKMIELRLTTRDRFSNVLEAGNTSFLTDKITQDQAESIIDEGNGSYRFQYFRKKSGSYSFRPQMLEPDGIIGTYYDGSQMVDMTPTNLVLQRQDPQIDFDFSINAPKGVSTMQQFMIHWSGYLLPEYSELYRFEIDHLGTILAFSIDQISLLAMDSNYKGNSSRFETQIYLEKSRFVRLEVIFAKSRWLQEAYVRLLWSSYSKKREVISNMQLFSASEVMNSPTAIVIPDFTSPLASETSFGDSTIIAVAGAVHRFQVIARDQYGNKRQTGGDTIIVRQLQAPEDSRIRATVKDFENGTYNVDIIPILAGYFSIVIGIIPSNDPKKIEMLGEAIGTSYFLQNLVPYQLRHSPFTLKTIPGDPISRNARLLGPGAHFATAGQPRDFHLELRDSWDNRVSDGGQSIDVRLGRISSLEENEVDDETSIPTEINAQVVFAQEGTYKIHYQCNKSGIYALQLRIGSEINYTRRQETVYVSPAVASASTSVLCGNGLRPMLKINTIQSFRIDLMDSYGNALHKGGDLIRLRVVGPVGNHVAGANGLTFGNVQDLANGSYSAQYTIQKSGIYQIQIELARPKSNGVSMYAFATSDLHPVEAAVKQSLEPHIIFDAQRDLRFRGYQRIKWVGYIEPSYTESYQFQVDFQRNLVGEAVIIWLENVVILDTKTGDHDKAIDMVAAQLYKICIDYFAPKGRNEYGSMVLYWKSDRQLRERIPEKSLHAFVDEIQPKFSILATD